MSVSNRVALAPIRDSCLNTSNTPKSKPTSNDSTPLRKKKRSPPILTASSATSMATTPAALTPIYKKRPTSFAVTSSTPTPAISSSIVSSASASKRVSPAKSLSFSDYRSSSSTASSPNTSKTIKNDTAGLAATKLKLKLQMALYKIQHHQNQSRKPVKSEPVASPSITSTSKTSVLPPSADISVSLASNPRGRPTTLSIHRPTSRPYLSSVNINLKTKAKLLSSAHQKRAAAAAAASFPSLSNIARSDSLNKALSKKSQKLRLFKIKKNSIFYSTGTSNKQLPLSIDNIKLPKPMLTSLANSISSQKNMSQTKPVPAQSLPSASNMPHNSFILPYINQPEAPKAATNLPSINKILKTPIKNTNSTRHLLNAANKSSLDLNFAQVSHQDDTIDEDGDATILNTTYNNNTTLMHNAANATSSSTGNQSGDSSDETELDSRPKTAPTPKLNRKRSASNILTSSPIANHFGTPNSFSVAKSLLQLGGYSM